VKFLKSFISSSVNWKDVFSEKVRTKLNGRGEGPKDVKDDNLRKLFEGILRKVFCIWGEVGEVSGWWVSFFEEERGTGEGDVVSSIFFETFEIRCGAEVTVFKRDESVELILKIFFGSRVL